MNLRYYTMIGSLSALTAGGALLALSPGVATAQEQEQGYEELTRGPVHEAFAESVSTDPEPGMFVKVAPPTLIEEVPPEQRPEGDNVSWIPGYWGWDEEQNDFIWISGVWRNLPPGRQWVPGYWGEAEDQWQWTSGYWANEETEEVTYLPKPPKSIESGPNVEAPSSNHIWVSGTWIQREDRYAWRPGYWEPGQENWTWIPAHYQWTPRGYVFIDGYWDYDVDRRGVVFAPVRFRHEYYNRPNYSYTPLMVISLNVFVNHLFVRPRYGHYYFGDYYEPRYRDAGYYTPFTYHSRHGGYDPIYTQLRWKHRDDRDWERRRRDDFDFYRDNADARPPRTWAALMARPEDRRRGKRDNFEFAEPLKQYANRKDSGQRFESVSADSREKMVEQRQQMRKFSQDRKQLENRADDKAEETSDKKIKVKHEKFSKSPVMAKSAEQLTGKDAPPKRREPRTADLRDLKTDDAEKTDKTGKPSNEPRGRMEEPGRGKGKEKNADSDQGKKSDPTVKPEGNDRPKRDTDSKKDKENGPDTKGKEQDTPRPSQKANDHKGGKSDENPNRMTDEPKQPKKQPALPETNIPKEPKPEQKVEPPQRKKSEQPPSRQDEPKQKQKAAPEPARQIERKVQEQPAPEKQKQKFAPEPNRQSEPKPQSRPAPERQKQREPERAQQPQRAPQPERIQQPKQQPQQQQARPEKNQDSPRKKDKDEDPDSPKKNR